MFYLPAIEDTVPEMNASFGRNRLEASNIGATCKSAGGAEQGEVCHDDGINEGRSWPTAKLPTYRRR
jgi:hypothetical protein